MSIQTQLNTKIASVSADTAPSLGGNLTLGTFALLGKQHNAAVASPTSYIETEYIHSTTLTASTTAIAANFTYAQATFNSIYIDYYMVEASTGNTRQGRLSVTTNGATTSLTDTLNETGLLNVTWTCAVATGNVQLTYTAGNANNVTMRANITRFLA